MNRTGLLLRFLAEHPGSSQRELAAGLSLSLGTVNTLLKDCIQQGLIEPNDRVLTEAGRTCLEEYRVDGALIIAAGFGSRFVPLTFEMPKGLLEVFGERMIERQIRQLHEVGITKITIVVGYLKEKFEYLIDQYGVELLYNPEYSCKNTLATIYRAREILRGKNMYILSSDNWMRNNMYHTWECGSWYASSYMEGNTSEWVLSCNRKGRITDIAIGGHDAWVMYGPVFFSRSFSEQFLPLLEKAYHTPGTEQFYWEHVLMQNIHDPKLEIAINRQPKDQIYEFENLEELRLFDPKYQNRSDNRAMELVAEVFRVPESEIHDIRCLKSGMTNQSFLFMVHGTHYICRIPGKGTELLINRPQEAAVYDVIRPLKLSEHVIYINPENGYKISEYYEGARNANAADLGTAFSQASGVGPADCDMTSCMRELHKLHDARLTVDHEFNLRERIGFYEKLCQAHGGTLFEDYDTVRGWMNQLMDRLDQLNRPKYLSHIDSVADNFLFLPDGSVRLIDWEYAGMCDPLVDVAMCAIYSYYDEAQTDQLIRLYYQTGTNPDAAVSETERFVIYAYMALGGFLWSLWAIYKSALGVEFGDYTIVMYRYAKKYYRKCCTML